MPTIPKFSHGFFFLPRENMIVNNSMRLNILMTHMKATLKKGLVNWSTKTLYVDYVYFYLEFITFNYWNKLSFVAAKNFISGVYEWFTFFLVSFFSFSNVGFKYVRVGVSDINEPKEGGWSNHLHQQGSVLWCHVGVHSWPRQPSQVPDCSGELLFRFCWK
jgi:hypothetical protein